MDGKKLFCDLNTDEEKSAFFLSGRGYETGVIAAAIQNDVAMAYHRCAAARVLLREKDAEIERLRAALTPSAETKAAYMGEFTIPLPDRDEDGNEVMRSINMPWTTIKEIMAAIRAYAEASVIRPEGEKP